LQEDRYQVLNPDVHGDLKVRQGYSAELGDNVMFSMVFPPELRNVQASYPILFQKNADDGTFFTLALFGFEQGENLFLTDSGWEDMYIPQMIRRQPLLIGFQQGEGDQRKAVISIDTESPKLSREEGEPLFLPHGGASDYLSEMSDLLERIHNGHRQTQKLTKLLLAHELLEPFALEVTLDSGEQCQLMGFYAINEDKLQALSTEALHEFNQAGALAAVFMIVASQAQFRQLVIRKNRRA
jgi:hypothetical protein